MKKNIPSERIEIIRPQSSWFDLKIRELWQYRDLILLFVRRDFVATYKQTVLGIAWYFVEPFVTTVLFTIVFGGIAQISTDELPAPLFYMCGIIIWNLFAKVLKQNAQVFTANAGIFGKVYFPRMSVVISNTFSAMISFGIQFLFFLCFYVYYWSQNAAIAPQPELLLFPVLLFIPAAGAIGTGILISAFSVRYKDLAVFVTFGIQLLMYLSPVIYPASEVGEKYRDWVFLNPMASVLEAFRFVLLGKGSFDVFLADLFVCFCLRFAFCRPAFFQSRRKNIYRYDINSKIKLLFFL